jgi:hypothetical protein
MDGPPMIIDLLNEFKPEPDILLREISQYVTDEMLEEISLADYGEDVEDHLLALRQVRDSTVFPSEMHWVPMEVLELIRWSEPEDPEWKPGRTGEFGHWMRAFSCAAILRAEYEPYNYRYNNGCTDSTVIQLIFSLRALPVDLSSHALKHLLWLLLRIDPEGRDDQVRIYGVGLLWFALQVIPAIPDQTLISLARWVARRADEVNWRSSSEGRSGLREMVLDCQKRKAWEVLGSEFCDLELDGRSADLLVWVEMIGEQLAG